MQNKKNLLIIFLVVVGIIGTGASIILLGSVSGLSENLKESQNQVKTLEEENAGIKNELLTLKDENSALKKELDDKENSRQYIIQDNLTLEGKLKACEEKSLASNTELENAAKKIEELNSQITNLKADNEALKAPKKKKR